MRKYLCVSCVLALALVVAIPASAKTPDGQTPAEETVCDGQIGAAYGLCVAYCEAMDCDSPAPHASPTACSRVEANFLRHTGQPVPCGVSCPCPEALPLFAAFVNEIEPEPIAECFIDTDVITLFAADQQFTVVVNNGAEGFCTDNGVDSVGLSDAEALVCRLLLLDTAEAQGVDCQGPE